MPIELISIEPVAIPIIVLRIPMKISKGDSADAYNLANHKTGAGHRKGTNNKTLHIAMIDANATANV